MWRVQDFSLDESLSSISDNLQKATARLLQQAARRFCSQNYYACKFSPSLL